MNKEKRRYKTDASLVGGNSQVGYELMNTDSENQKGDYYAGDGTGACPLSPLRHTDRRRSTRSVPYLYSTTLFAILQAPATHIPFTYLPPMPRSCPISVPPLPYLVPYLICSSHLVSTQIHPQTSKYAVKRPRTVSCNKTKPPTLCPAVSTIEPDFP